jgi:hypothetical protein
LIKSDPQVFKQQSCSPEHQTAGASIQLSHGIAAILGQAYNKVSREPWAPGIFRQVCVPEAQSHKFLMRGETNVYILPKQSPPVWLLGGFGVRWDVPMSHGESKHCCSGIVPNAKPPHPKIRRLAEAITG